MAKRGENASGVLEGVIRGDQPIAQYIFGDPRKRRLIKQLQRDGWPIFDLAGKRCAFPADLDATMGKTLAQVRPTGQRRRHRQREREAAAT